MFLTIGKINQIIARLEESDKAISGSVARDQIMWSQTSIFTNLGMQNKELMKKGMELYAQTMATFKTDMMALVSSYQQGNMSRGAAMLQFKRISGAHYQTLFKAGAMTMGNPYYASGEIGLTKKDLSFIQKARNMEGKFFRKFLLDIENPNFVPKHGFQQRAGYYADSGKAQFFNGMVNGAGDNVEIHWVMSEAVEKHCHDCPVLATKVYTWQTLPTTPRAGDTECLFNCQCELEFAPKQASAPTGMSFNPVMPGSANQKAMEVPGRWAVVTNAAGEQMVGQLAKEVEDLYQQMFKARQMVTLTTGEIKKEWIATRRGLNDLIIQKMKAGNYRVTPSVSVLQLKTALASAVEKGTAGLLTSEIMKAGQEVVFLRGNFWTVGVIELRGTTAYVKTAKGTMFAYNDDTDLVFGIKKLNEPEFESLTEKTLVGRKMRRFLLKSIFFGNALLFSIYLQLYDVAVADGSAIPHERAMIKFREYYAETTTGWILRPGMTPPKVESLEEGGMGSGNWGHIGRPDKVGGSAKGGGKDKLAKYVKKVKKNVDLDKYLDELAEVYSNWKQEDAEKMVFFTRDGTMIVIGSDDKGYVDVSLAGIQQILIANGSNIPYLKRIVHNHNKGEDFSKGDEDIYKTLVKYGFKGEFQIYTPKTGQVRTMDTSVATGGKD